ncbi:MAG: zinc metallopeptidase [Christensenellaceae bacterium]|jgi:Zn-dependent membrane protease YugP
MPFLWFDWTWLILIPAFIVSIWAQVRVSNAYKKYAGVPVRSGVSGRQLAEEMLRKNNVAGVYVKPVSGQMTDHFDPRSGTVSLSEGVYGKSSVAAVSIAAHEVGHVLQREQNYGPMKVRSALVPVANLASNLALPMILIGILFASFDFLITIGAWLYFASVIFQVVTLPVEFNASKRAMQNISAMGVMTETEQAEAKNMLSAAAMTYVAAMLASFLSFLRLLLLSRRRR